MPKVSVKSKLTNFCLLASLSFYSSVGQSEAPLNVIVYDREMSAVAPVKQDQLVPLGSLWKLFVSAYLVESHLNQPLYRCAGQDSEEIFCCKKDEAIDFDQALAQSCGPYFSPKRLRITSRSWKSFWQERISFAKPWLWDIENMQPATRVSLNDLLTVLAEFPAKLKEFPEIERKLLGVVINGTAAHAIRHLGTSFRVKTYTWRDEPNENFSGGFAGWLQNGKVVFAHGQGSGGKLVKSYLSLLENIAFENLAPSKSSVCVRVKHFEQYPISKIINLQSQKEVKRAAELQGSFSVHFKNGNKLSFSNSFSGLRLTPENKIMGEYAFEDYIARVLQREVFAEPLEAAKAFAVAARTYLLQNAIVRNGCFEIPDSTHFQRVAIGELDSRYLKIARWSDGLILKVKPGIRYHSSSHQQGQLSWDHAKELAAAGLYFDQILLDAYSTNNFELYTHQHYEPCLPLSKAFAFVRQKQNQWRGVLKRKVGYSEVKAISVCKTNLNNPYSVYSRGLIFLPHFNSEEDQVSLAHEYVHLSFQDHPISRDERFVEETARSLLFTPEVMQ
jgi:uncharacterized protein YfaQ (DUF2300 family)